MAKGLVSPIAPFTGRQITIKSHLSEHFIDARMLICRIVKSTGEWHLLEGYSANFKIEPHAHAARREKNCEIVLERARHISLFMAGRAPLLRAIRSEDSGQDLILSLMQSGPFGCGGREDANFSKSLTIQGGPCGRIVGLG